MNRFTDSVRAAIDQNNWYAALTLALLLPDICGSQDDPQAGSKKRFKAWFDQWLLPQYSSVRNGQHVVWLSGADCYALRCALSHEGTDILAEKTRDALTRFLFVAPHPSIFAHRNYVNGALQLQVDVFCEDMCKAVDSWSSARSSGETSTGQNTELITIRDLSGGIPGFLVFDSD